MMAISGEQHSKVSTFFKFTLPMFLYFTKSIATNSIAGSATHAFRAVADPQPAANCFSEWLGRLGWSIINIRLAAWMLAWQYFFCFYRVYLYFMIVDILCARGLIYFPWVMYSVYKTFLHKSMDSWFQWECVLLIDDEELVSNQVED